MSARDEDDDEGKEVALEVGGQKMRAKGYRLVDLIWLPLILGVSYICMTSYQHDAQAQEQRKELAQTLKESNAVIAKELKESNEATVRALRELTMEQKRSTNAMKETACLLDPVMRNRADAREFCKRMTGQREDR